jgi:hypothetical protein
MDKCHLFLSFRPLTPTIRARDNLRQVENLIEQDATVVTKNFEVQNAYQSLPVTIAYNMILLHQCLRIATFLSPGSALQ